ncbi:Glucosyl-3-phosphoglycerate/mannosyl-3-phosphoglycerate phosphatase [Thalassovita gelatinovora]|uniref:Glucosyl-3-phosphoglycerate/mannosyl-3-phosphoglycerate phosphatase n=1 Tax=Thalassovita gelatinovora TaxID=53501 RepID=A0A0P1FEX0_THAGE|nr:HAD hydrolase family protein [Thalassovita gelatinovora]QIZ79699.1 HAD hydrolase family protein [Thalassovita gelatinovora]CUH66681.1 Glucosyl-3-phosphoglycerate/mannosyl-3-phosphoglycerate phosphatase [Thalassovita gelatinovora]SEQ40653.1 mannosyl-3-phosphoglycerate phosphatase [Thalassovita gelatinovora]
MTKAPLIVFTDLDGTLLDHDSYSHAAAAPALMRLREIGAPMILASSKTAAEIAPLRDELDLTAYPAIVENGAGILPAFAKPTVGADDYVRIRTALDQVVPDLRRCFTGFGDMDAQDVARSTGLPLAQARLARQRSFSEPGEWAGNEQERGIFEQALAVMGIAARYGGRYLTLSLGSTKADRMDEIADLYGNPPRIALGDAPNDLEMLMAADYPVLIKNPHAKPLPPLPKKQAYRLLRSTKTGPSGWNHMVLSLISDPTNNKNGA